ncbi:hypothetical protein OAG94_02440, partial [bacterium]|nr:hypothetical protein [bacterium]
MWFGQEGAEYPPVVSPKNFETIKVINVVAVEACYGARFIDLPIEESILLTSLLNKTVAFSGSSRIALGPSVPPIGLADIIANDFLIGVKDNDTTGEAFVNSRLTVLECELLDPAGILTVVEFNLFGDPSLRFPNAARKAKAETISRVSKPTSKSIIDDPLSSVRRSLDRARRQTRVTMPDYLGAVRDASDSVWAEIENTINRHIYREHPEFEGQSPTVNLLHLGREKLKSAQFSYSKRLGPIFSGIVLYVKEDGSIISKYQTK